MKKSRLLMKEHPIVIDKELAKIIGLNESIVLQQIEYWININEKAKKESNFQDNFYWTYNTVEEWQEEFQFWSYDTVKRTLKKLRDKGILITNRFNKEGYDRTLWYRIDYEVLNKLDEEFYTISAKCPNEENQCFTNEKKCKALKTVISAKCPNALGQNAPSNTKDYYKDFCSSSSSNLKDLFEQSICELKKTTTVNFQNYVDKYSEEFIFSIINYCDEINIKSFAGFKVIIDNYINKKILTAAEFIKSIEEYRKKSADLREEERNKRKSRVNKKNVQVRDAFTDYDQRTYNFKELESKLLDKRNTEEIPPEGLEPSKYLKNKTKNN